jgi:ribose transport system ATP-binding protein
MISEELSELIGMCDRLIIMKDFTITKEFQRSPSLKETDVIEYML